MWICMNDAFFSVVRTSSLPEAHLLVRSRRPGDIERYWPEAEVTRTPGRDYLFRAALPEQAVRDVIASAVSGIDYDNFKNSVRDDDLHDAYFSVWQAMARLQRPPPYQSS